MAERFYIAVIGGADCSQEEELLAYNTGKIIAERNGTVICGGGSGVMEAAARGAREANGNVIGILPGMDHRQGNSYLTDAVATGLGEARNAVITRTADVVIAIGGEYGTLSEIALALKMRKRVIGLKTWMIKPSQAIQDGIIKAATPKEAVELALKNCLKEFN